MVAVALVACLVASIAIARNVRLTEYTSHRRGATLREVVFTNLATLVGGWMFFGLNAIGHLAGVLGYIIGVAYAAGLILLAFSVPRIKLAMDREHCDNLDDYIGARFGPLARSLSTILNFVFFVAILGAQFIAMAAFLNVFLQTDSRVLFYLSAVVVIGYTAFAGFRGVLLTDVWQFVVLAFAIVIEFLVLATHADWHVVGELDSKYLTGLGFGWVFLAGITLIFPFSILVRSDFWQRISSAKDAKTARLAFLISAPALVIFYVLLTTSGLIGRISMGADARPDTSAMQTLLDTVLSWGTAGRAVVGILALGVFASLLSTIDSNLNLVAVSLSKLLARRRWAAFDVGLDTDSGTTASLERLLLSHARVVTVFVGVAGVIVATLVPDIVNLIVGAVAAVMIFIPAVLWTLFGRRAAPAAAVVSFVAGFATLVPFLLLAPKWAIAPPFLSAVVGFVVMLPFDKTVVKEGGSP